MLTLISCQHLWRIVPRRSHCRAWTIEQRRQREKVVTDEIFCKYWWKYKEVVSLHWISQIQQTGICCRTCLRVLCPKARYTQWPPSRHDCCHTLSPVSMFESLHTRACAHTHTRTHTHTFMIVCISSVSPKGSNCGLLHTLSVSWGKWTAGEKSVRKNTHSPQTAALQVHTHTHTHLLCLYARITSLSIHCLIMQSGSTGENLN